MYVRHSLLSAIVALCALGAEGTPTKTPSPTIAKRAVEPTATGQIGVNPVTDLPASEYTSIDGPATEWYDQSSNYRKIGVNTEYLTEISTTVESRPTIIKPVITFITVATAVPAAGIEAGDVQMIMAPKLKDALNSIAEEVAAACPGKKRQACNRPLRFAQAAQAEIRPGGRLDFDLEGLIEIPTITASDVAAVLSQIPNAALVLGPIVLAYIVATHANTGGGPPKIAPVHNIPANMAGGKADNPSPTSSGGCPTDAPKGADAPVCTDEDCKGPNDGPKDKVRVCSEGKWKDCPCLRSGTFIAEATDPDYLKAQQDMFQWVLDHDGDFSKPWCIHGASPRSGRTPSDYCMCGENGATYYPIAEKKEGEEYNPCPYTEKDHPKETLTFQDPPKQTEAPPPPPPAPQPTCNTNPCGDFEKAKKDFPWVHLGTATEAGHKFCADNKGKAVVEGRDNLQGTYDDAPDHKNFEGGPMQFLIKVDRVDTNADKTLDEKDCNTAVDVIRDLQATPAQMTSSSGEKSR